MIEINPIDVAVIVKNKIYNIHKNDTTIMFARHRITFCVFVGLLFLGSVSLVTDIVLVKGQPIDPSINADDVNKILYRGIVTSEPVVGGVAKQDAVILPHTKEGIVYEGVLTYTASKPVDVILGHRLPIDNATYSLIDPQKFGKLHIFNTTGSPASAPGILASPTWITPDYGISPPYFSASIPFVASSVYLGTPKDPFIAVYEVSAKIAHPESVIKIDSANIEEENIKSK